MASQTELARLVIRLEADTKAIRAQLGAVDARMKKSAAQAQALRKTMAGIFIALAAGRVIKRALIDPFAQFDAAMNQSLAIMGDVSEAMEDQMARAAMRAGEALNFAAKQGAEAFFFLASAGLSAAQSVAALPQVAAFAKAGMFDFATATDLATDAQSALGLTVKNAQQNLTNLTRITDVLVKANTLANATVRQFSEALTNDAGAALRAFNIDVEEGVSVLAAYADQGVKANVAGSALARVIRLLTKAWLENREEFERLGIAVFDNQGDMNRMADIVGQMEVAFSGMSTEARASTLATLGFQARVQQVILPLLGTSARIRDYEAALREAAGTTNEVANKQMATLIEQMGALKTRFVNLVITITKEYGDKVTNKLKTLNAAWDAHAESILIFGTIAIKTVEAVMAPFIALTRILFNFGQALGAILNSVIAQIRRDFKAMEEANELFIQSFKDMGDALNDNKDSWADLGKELAMALGLIPRVREQVGGLRDDLGEDVVLGIDEAIDVTVGEFSKLQQTVASFGQDFVRRTSESLTEGREAWDGFFDHITQRLAALALEVALFQALSSAFPTSDFVKAFGASIGLSTAGATAGPSGASGGAPGASSALPTITGTRGGGFAASAGGARGGGSGASQVVQNITFTVSAIDGRDAARFIEQRKGDIAKVIGDAARESQGFRRSLISGGV